jgi:hypothetical protein
MDNQLNELSKGVKTSSGPKKYNLRSKKKEGKPNIPEQSTRAKKPAKDVAKSNKGKRA